MSLFNAPSRPEPIDLARAQALWDEARRAEGLEHCLQDPEAEDVQYDA